MYFLLKMVIFQPAMLVYQKVVGKYSQMGPENLQIVLGIAEMVTVCFFFCILVYRYISCLGRMSRHFCVKTYFDIFLWVTDVFDISSTCHFEKDFPNDLI